MVKKIVRNMQWDKKYEQDIRDLTLFQVNNAVKKYWDRDNISVVKAGDSTKMVSEEQSD